MLAHNLSSWLFKNGILIMVENLQPFIYIYMGPSPNKSPNQQNGAPFISPLSCHQVHCSCELREFCAGLSALLRQQLPLLPDEPGGNGNAAGGKEETPGRVFLCGSHSHVVFFLAKRSTEDMCTYLFVCTITIIII